MSEKRSSNLQQIINSILNPEQPRAAVPSFSYRGPGSVKPVTPGLAQPKDNMFARPMFAEGGKVGEVVPGTADVTLRDKPKEVAQRGFVVPFADMSDGSSEWALPLILGGGVIDLIQNFGKYGDDDQYNTEQVMNALPVSGFGVARAAMKPATDGMELGIFAGRNAKTADLSKLKLAEEFEAKGFAPELIRKGTGWFRGADKQWRYEIDDSQMQLLGSEGKDNLAAALSHDKLYEAYPDLKDIPFEQMDDKRFYGLYHPPFGPHAEKIQVQEGLEPQKVRQTLIHELQHAIQNREKFAPGAHPAFFQRTPEQMESLANQAKEYLSSYVLRKLMDKGLSESDAILKMTQDYGAIIPGAKAIELAKTRTAAELDDATNYVQRVVRNASEPMKAYNRTAGEAEAMAAMKRMDMSEVARLHLSPLIDEGVPRNEQIIVDHRTGMQKPAAMAMDDDSFLKTFTGDNPYDEMHSLSVNPKLREGHPLTPKNEEAVKRLDSIFAEAPKTDSWMLVYRGAPKGSYKGISTDPAFMSTSRSRDVAEEFAQNIPEGGEVYEILIPPKTSYLDMRGKSFPGMEYQDEIMFPRGGSLRETPKGPYVLEYTKKASGGSVTDKMLEARALAIEPAAPNLGTTTQPREAEARAYDPTWRDSITTTLLGEDPSPEWRTMVQGITGSSAGLGTDSIGILDATPVGLAFAGQEGKRAQEEGDYLTAGLNYAAFLPMGRVPQAVNKAKMFSMGAEMARDLPQAKGTRQQMLATLKGVPKAELQQAGLVDDAGNIIGDPNAQLTRQELVEMFESKLPQIDETVLGKKDKPGLTPEQQARYDELRNTRVPYGNLTNEEADELTALSDIIRQERIGTPTKFSSHTLPGGENYREVLLKAPGNDSAQAKKAFEEEMQQKYGSSWIRQLTSEEMERGTAINRAANGSNYQSQHWPGQPNVIAHMRMSDRTGPNGEKLLHIEEIQSDWAQQGRKKGFKSDEKPDGLPSAPYVKDTAQWTDLALKRALREAAEGGYDRLIITPGAEQAKRYNLSNVVDSIISRPRQGQFEGQRRIYISGNRNSYDITVDKDGKVTTASKSDFIGKNLDEIVGKDVAKRLINPEKPNIKDFEIRNVDTDIGNRFELFDKASGVSRGTFPSRRAADEALGLMELQGANGEVLLAGFDLDIGGKGMKKYYDNIVPNQLNKLVKKLDKSAKVEPYSFNTQAPPRPWDPSDNPMPPEIFERAARDLGYLSESDQLDSLSEIFEHANATYLKPKDGSSADIQTLSIPITPLMREEIMKGLPGFKKGGRVLRRAPGGEVMLPEIVVGEEPAPLEEEEALPPAPWASAAPAAPPGTPLPEAPWAKPTRSSAFATGALQGLTANFYDELAGIYGAGVYEYLSGDPEAKKKYEQIVAEERRKASEAEEAFPGTSFVGEVVGALPAMALIPGGAATRGLSYAQQVIRQALAGGIYGGAAGAGEGTDAQSRAEGAAWGTGLGTLGGAAAPAVSKSVAWTYDRTLKPMAQTVGGWMRPDNVTAARVAGAIMQDQKDIVGGKVKGLSLQDWQAAKARGEPVTLADLGAGRTQALLRSAANSSPEGRAAIEEVIETRFKNQAERVATDIRHITGTRADAIKTADQLRAEYDLKRTPMYKKAFAQPNAQVMWSPEYEQLAQAPVVQEAIRGALVAGKDAAAKAGFTPLQNPFKMNPATGRFELQPGQYPNLQFWDAVKKNLDKINSRESQFWAKTLRGKLDDAVPEYGDARGMAHKFFGEEDALEAGRKLAGKKQIVTEELKKQLRQLDKEELELFREGYAYDMAERVVKNISETRNLTKAIYNTPGERERILAIFGPQGAAKLEARMALEAIMDGARQALGNSTTARQLIEAGLAGGAAGAVLSGGDLSSIAAGAAAGPVARRAMAMEALSGINSLAGYVDRGVARRVAEALVSDDPAKIQEGIELVAKNERLRAGITDIANALINATAARTAQ